MARRWLLGDDVWSRLLDAPSDEHEVARLYALSAKDLSSICCRRGPHVLDGLVCHQSGLAIEEHAVDTGGVSDHFFGLLPFLVYRSQLPSHAIA